MSLFFPVALQSKTRMGPVPRLLLVIVLLAGTEVFPAEPIRGVAFHEPFAPPDSVRPTYAPRVSDAPQLDGDLGDHAWKGVPPATGFFEHLTMPARAISPGQTSIRCVHTADALFVAAQCAATAPGRIKRDLPADSRDGDVFQDDCIELVLVVGTTEMRFAITAGGARADSRDGDPQWNADWTAATTVGDREWTVEVAIPFTALQGRRPPGPHDPGSSLRFNVGRSTAPTRLVSSLYPGYDDRRQMGELVIGTAEQRKARQATRRGLHFSDVTLLLDKWDYDAADHQARGRLRLVDLGPATDGPTELRGRLSVLTADGKNPIHTTDTTPLTAAVWDFDADVGDLPPGSYLIRGEILDGTDKVLRTVQHPLIRRRDQPRPATGRVPLRIDLPDATAALVSEDAPLPIYAGVPLPRIASTKASRYRLVDAKGRELPCQAEPITTWSPRGDTQFLGVRFLAESRDVSRCELQFDAAGADQPLTSVRAVVVIDKPSGIVVDTGPLRFEIVASRFDGLHRVWFDSDGDGSADPDKEIMAENPAGPYVIDGEGNRYETRLDPHTEVTVESSGPLCAVIRCAGWYQAADGGRICRHVTRFVAHGGLPWLRVYHTLVFCADSREVAIADVAWPVQPREPVATARFGGEPRPIPVTVTENRRLSLLQHEPDAFVLRDVAINDPRDLKMLAEGKIAGGWAEVAGTSTAVAVGLRDFAATYPRELSADEGGLVLHLWPANGIDKPVKPPTQDDLSEMWFLHHRRLLDFKVPEWFSSFQAPGPFVDAAHKQSRHRYVRASATANGMGVARSCEFFLNFRRLDRDTVRPVWTYVNVPPLAAASPAWMCSAGAFGPLEPVDRGAFPLIEQALDVRHDGERTIERFSVGMFNHGGSTSYFRPAVHSYDQLDRPWRLTHHGSPRVPWLLFARSGDRKFADYAMRHGQWCADIGFCHYSTPQFERLGVEGKIRGGQCDYKGIVPWSRGGRVMDYNSMADFLIWMACFSGDRRPLEVADEWGQCVKQRFRPVVGRNAAGTLDTLMSLYEATWDMDYRELAERQFLAIANKQFLPSGHFRHGPWYDYAPWLAHYHRFTGSERAAEVAVTWSNRLLRDCWLGDGTFGDDTKFVREMGYPLFDVFRIAFEATADHRYLDIAHGCSLLPALSTTFAPDTPFHGFDTYATASHGGYYTQTVPYILPALKANDHGRALFPPWTLHGRRIQFFVDVAGDEPLELRMRLVNATEATGAAVAPPHVKFMDAHGRVAGPMPVEIVRRPTREEAAEPPLDGENARSVHEYARIEVPANMRNGVVAVVIAYPGAGPEAGVRLPVEMSREARLVFTWDRDMRFGRGSAIYFQPPRNARSMAFRAESDYRAMPHMIALLDSRDQIRAIRTWQPTPGADAAAIEAAVPPEDGRGVWCCLQGLTKYMTIEPVSAGTPRYFADRPERFFIPDLPR